MNLTLLFLIPFASLAIIFLLFFLKKNYQLFVDHPIDEVRKIHTESIITIGGVSLVSVTLSILNLNSPILINSLLVAYLLLLIGLIADLNKNFNSSQRFIIMLFIIGFYIITNNLYVNDLNHELLNQIFLSSKIVSFIFILLSLMFIVNGFNFIDGNNGLILGTAIIILVNFFYYTNGYNKELDFLILSLLLSIGTLFIFNFFFGNIICGDNGSYFLGFIIGIIAILISNENLIYSTKIACIVFYPVFELFFSFWRRIFVQKTKPFNPDHLHLHSLVYRALKLKLRKSKINFSLKIINSLTSSLILTALVIISALLNLYAESFGYLNFFSTLCFIYLITYVYLYKLLKNNN
tara:strand:- start:5145 stop:6197 length:1053 start_codon:yes stop_codon:yes gene_type:complete